MKIAAEDIKALARAKGADLIGIASASRIAQACESLSAALTDEKSIIAENRPQMLVVGGTDIHFVARGIEKVRPKKPGDYLPQARSVLVLGLHYPYALAEQVAQPPAENIGPYVCFVKHEMPGLLQNLAFDIIRWLQEKGYQAVGTLDLEGMSFPPHFANRLAAVCAGLGEFGLAGHLLTPQFGFAQRTVSIITDALLPEDPLYEGQKLCQRCGACLARCPVEALRTRRKIILSIEGKKFSFARRDRLKCEWAHRFGLVGAEGPQYMGCQIDVTPPKRITTQAFSRAMKQIQQWSLVERLNWNYTFEGCVVSCAAKGTRYAELRG